MILYPLLDKVLQPDDENLTKEEIKRLQGSVYFSLPMVALVLIDTVFFFSALIYLQENYEKLNVFKVIGAIISIGIVTAGTLNISHELIHRETVFERILGKINLCRLLFGHYPIAHINHHHKYVGSDLDPVCSPIN
jgi:alkane 1-monooxygenase